MSAGSDSREARGDPILNHCDVWAGYEPKRLLKKAGNPRFSSGSWPALGAAPIRLTAYVVDTGQRNEESDGGRRSSRPSASVRALW